MKYDYSQTGYYFVTICCQNRECLFGEIVANEIVLNDAGEMVQKIPRFRSGTNYITGVTL